MEDEVERLHAKIRNYELEIEEYRQHHARYGYRIGRAISAIRSRYAPPGTFRLFLADKILLSSVALYRTVKRLKPQRVFPRNVSIAYTLSFEDNYKKWLVSHRLSHSPDRSSVTQESIVHWPLISVLLPVYKIEWDILEKAVNSIANQDYERWQLCIAYADPDLDNLQRLKRLYGSNSKVQINQIENGGISANTNRCLAMANGEFVALLDHDDELSVAALRIMAESIVRNTDADFLYSDKDSVSFDGSRNINPLFKPDWSPEMLYSVNYLTHLNVMRTSICREIGGWRPETDGAQDWDIFFRVTERARKVLRVPGVFYHWRIHPNSTSSGLSAKPYALSAQLRTQQSRLNRLGWDADIIPSATSGFRVIWREQSIRRGCLVFWDARPQDVEKIREQIRQARKWVDRVIVIFRSPVNVECGPEIDEIYSEDDMSVTELAGRIIDISGQNPVAFINAQFIQLSRSANRELFGWLNEKTEIGFVAGVVVDENDTVIEAGRISNASAESVPLFRNAVRESWGPFGSATWYRNVRVAGPDVIAFRYLTRNPTTDTLEQFFDQQCSILSSSGLRGLVNPHIRLTRTRRPGESQSVDLSSASLDPYFTPWLRCLMPLELQ